MGFRRTRLQGEPLSGRTARRYLFAPPELNGLPRAYRNGRNIGIRTSVEFALYADRILQNPYYHFPYI